MYKQLSLRKDQSAEGGREYRVVTDSFDHPDGFRYTTYGISVLENGEEVISYRDISTGKQWVEELAAKCVEGGVPAYQFRDVLDDSLE